MVDRLNNLNISILIILFSFLSSSCGTVYKNPPSISKAFGTPVLYKDKKHPGVDYNVSRNTPIIACSNGTVWRAFKLGSKPWEGGYFVMIKHGHYLGKPFIAEYFHLSKIFVSEGENISRGELIGLSGASNDGNVHLHFGLHFGVTGIENHYDPQDFWLEKKSQCFDSKRDYSALSDTELTHPVACGSYSKEITIP